MRIDLHELETSLFPMYKDALYNITVQKSDLSTESQHLTTVIRTQGYVVLGVRVNLSKFCILYGGA